MNVLLRTILTLLVFSRAPAFASVEQVSQEPQEEKPTQNQVSPLLFKHNLSGLYGINSYSSKITQPYQDFETLYSMAYEAQTELETLCTSTALVTGSIAQFSGVKSKQRAETKVQTDLNGDASRITDLARATIVSDDIGSLVSTFELLEKQARVVQVKNRFKKPTASGYRDLNILLELPNSKVIAEVQLHLAEIAEVKNGPEHKIYEEIQLVERRAIAEDRSITELELAHINKLRNESVSLYQDAWQPYITTRLHAA